MDLTKYSAMLFDLDGTIANSMDLHNQAWIATIKAHGYAITAPELQRYAGVSNHKTIALFNEKFGWNLDVEKVISEKEARFLETMHKVEPIEGVLKLAHENFLQKPMAIVSGGNRRMVEQTLRNLKISHLFPVLVCAEDTVKGKPFPDPFLHAADLLNVAPGKCVVFEDGEPGIKGAQAAGMGVVKVGQGPLFSLELLN